MIRQAIIPLAGLGTRLLPITSVFPKELLPINGKPGIEYILDKNIYISKNLFLPKNTKLIVKPGVEIIFNKNVSIISEGSIYFNGSNDRPIIIRSDEPLNLGSIILKNNFFHINNVVFNNLSSPNFFSHILHGGINVIESELEFKNSKITNSKSEDAINVISSTSIFENIELNNISSDGIDIDFGKFRFQNIKCSQVNNDCLDIAGSIVNGNELYAENIFDKGLSIGEASIVEIENIYLYKNKLGIAVKDGSKVKVNNYNFDSNTYDMAVYTKKNEYKNSSLYIDGIKDFDEMLKRAIYSKGRAIQIGDSTILNLPELLAGSSNVNDLYRNILNKLGTCGFLDLLSAAFACLTSGIDLADAIGIIVRAAMKAMDPGNLEKLFIGLPPDKQMEIKQNNKKRL